MKPIITFRLKQELIEKLREKQLETKKTATDIIVEALTRYFSKK